MDDYRLINDVNSDYLKVHKYVKKAFEDYGVISIGLSDDVRNNRYGLIYYGNGHIDTKLKSIKCSHTGFNIDCSLLLDDYKSAYYQLKLNEYIRTKLIPISMVHNKKHIEGLYDKVHILDKIITDALNKGTIDLWNNTYLYKYSLKKIDGNKHHYYKIERYSRDLTEVREFALGMDIIIRVVQYEINKKKLAFKGYTGNKYISYPDLCDAPSVFKRMLNDILKDIKHNRIAIIGKSMNELANLMISHIDLKVVANRIEAYFVNGRDLEEKYRFYVGNTGQTYKAMGYGARAIARGGYTF